MRLLSEQLFTKNKYEDLIEKADIIRDYGCELVVPIKSKLLEKAQIFADKMNAKEVGVNFWPLVGHYLEMFTNRYWVNSFTAKNVANLLQKMKPVIKNPNVNSVVLDIESFFPFVGYLKNREYMREILEQEVDVIQKDYNKPITVMKWYWSEFMENTFHHPELRNPKKHVLMVYPSMMRSRFATKSTREKILKSAAEKIIRKYGEDGGIDIGGNHTGVYHRITYPFCKAFVYGSPEIAREDLQFLKENHIKSRGFYTTDGIKKERLNNYLKTLTNF